MGQLLTWLVDITGSYGLGIILLTVAVRVVILPLTIYQTRSMKKIQDLQPKLKELQAKHKGDQQKLNQETMELYKANGANPFSGCLPLLIQMPFLYAVFAVLQGYVPPEGVAPGFLWMDLLSQPDPYFILPGLTVASMFLQSWLTGAGSDPNQKMMMWMMPLLFGWFTFKMQAGVVLYWVVSTIFGLAQQGIYPGFPRLQRGAGPKGEAKAK